MSGSSALHDASDRPRYPAAYAEVIGVGAVGETGALYARGNRSSAVEIVGPGVEIVSTVPDDGFAFSDGTSLATAHVTGVLALLVAAGGDPVAAREALFQAGHADVDAATDRADLAPVCDALALVGAPCQ